MGDLLSMDDAARACSVSRDTIKRRLRAKQFPGAVRGDPTGNRPPPWLIPVEDLVAAGLRPVVIDPAASSLGPESDDPVALRIALTHHQVLASARESHLIDLRAEVRRLHERMEALLRILDSQAD